MVVLHIALRIARSVPYAEGDGLTSALRDANCGMARASGAYWSRSVTSCRAMQSGPGSAIGGREGGMLSHFGSIDGTSRDSSLEQTRAFFSRYLEPAISPLRSLLPR